MKMFVFEFIVSELTLGKVEKLAELQGGRPDCTCFSMSREHWVTFERKAKTLGSAIDSAMDQCKGAKLKVKGINIATF